MISLGVGVSESVGGAQEFVFLIITGYVLELLPGSSIQWKLQLETFQGIKLYQFLLSSKLEGPTLSFRFLPWGYWSSLLLW